MSRRTRKKTYTLTPGARKRRRRQDFGAVAVFILVCILLVGGWRKCSAEMDRAVVENKASAPKHFDSLDKVNGASPSSVEKEYEGFTLSFNPNTKVADWVAWELLGDETYGPVTRHNRFHTDRNIVGCPDTKDYSNSGYDRGHMCPAADQKWSSQAMSDCFFMTNIAPQKHELNAGAWKTLEEKERLWAKRDSAIIIVAGPLYASRNPERIGKARVAVPDAFFKCILAPYATPPRAIAFVYDNARCPGNMMDYALPVREVEQMTGLDFFHTLPDDIEEEVETVANFRQWNNY